MLQSQVHCSEHETRSGARYASQEMAMKSTAAVAHSLRSPFVAEEVDLPDLQHLSGSGQQERSAAHVVAQLQANLTSVRRQ